MLMLQQQQYKCDAECNRLGCSWPAEQEDYGVDGAERAQGWQKHLRDGTGVLQLLACSNVAVRCKRATCSLDQVGGRLCIESTGKAVAVDHACHRVCCACVLDPLQASCRLQGLPASSRADLEEFEEELERTLEGAVCAV